MRALCCLSVGSDAFDHWAWANAWAEVTEEPSLRVEVWRHCCGLCWVTDGEERKELDFDVPLEGGRSAAGTESFEATEVDVDEPDEKREQDDGQQDEDRVVAGRSDFGNEEEWSRFHSCCSHALVSSQTVQIYSLLHL